MNRVALAAVAALAALAAACSSSGGAAPAASGSDLVGQSKLGEYDGTGLIPAQPRPSFTLRDTAGKPFAFGSVTGGHPTFLFFGYTHCPDVCPATLADIRLALKEVPASVAAKTFVVFVTTDVKHDSAARIAQWMGQFSGGSAGHWVGLRGTQTQIDAAQAAAHITVAEDGGRTHSAEGLLYGPDDYAHVAFLQSSNEQQQMAHDLKIVAGAAA
jgi:protein SCO1/2